MRLFIVLSIFTFLLPVYTQQKKKINRVNSDIQKCRNFILGMEKKFHKHKVDLKSVDWVKKKLSHMMKIDQYIRKYPYIIYKKKYTAQERENFFKKYMPIVKKIDRLHTEEMKKLLKIHTWFIISKFGKYSDRNAWLLVQHADHDLEFQKKILALLKKLAQAGETKKEHYAYLYDRVQTNQKKPQLYGTQGRVINGEWNPFPIHNEKELDKRREEMEMEPYRFYKLRFHSMKKAKKRKKGYCTMQFFFLFKGKEIKPFALNINGKNITGKKEYKIGTLLDIKVGFAKYGIYEFKLKVPTREDMIITLPIENLLKKKKK